MGQRFGIYEGNHPQKGDQGSRAAVKLRIDPRARIGVAEGRGSIIVATVRGKGMGIYAKNATACVASRLMDGLFLSLIHISEPTRPY